MRASSISRTTSSSATTSLDENGSGRGVDALNSSVSLRSSVGSAVHAADQAAVFPPDLAGTEDTPLQAPPISAPGKMLEEPSMPFPPGVLGTLNGLNHGVRSPSIHGATRRTSLRSLYNSAPAGALALQLHSSNNHGAEPLSPSPLSMRLSGFGDENIMNGDSPSVSQRVRPGTQLRRDGIGLGGWGVCPDQGQRVAQEIRATLARLELMLQRRLTDFGDQIRSDFRSEEFLLPSRPDLEGDTEQSGQTFDSNGIGTSSFSSEAKAGQALLSASLGLDGSKLSPAFSGIAASNGLSSSTVNNHNISSNSNSNSGNGAIVRNTSSQHIVSSVNSAGGSPPQTPKGGLASSQDPTRRLRRQVSIVLPGQEGRIEAQVTALPEEMGESSRALSIPATGSESTTTVVSASKKRRSTQGSWKSPSTISNLTDAFMPMNTSISHLDPDRTWLQSVVASTTFELIMSVIILCNCFTMGLAAHHEVVPQGEGVVTFLDISEQVFTSVFVVEFLLRLYVLGRGLFWPLNSAETRFNFVDVALVIPTSVLVSWILPLMAIFWNLDFHDNSSLRFLTLLRTIRLVRLVRVVRKVPVFREAWLLIRGLNDSARTLFWTVTVIFFVTYAFAIFGLLVVVVPIQEARSVATDNDDIHELDDLLNAFEGIDKMMFSLVQVLTQDSFHYLMRELLSYVPMSWLYFYSYIAVGCLVLMNLVTAIIVENAMETSRNDHEQQVQEKAIKQKKQLRELKKLFASMDADGSGTLSWDEFRLSFDDPFMARTWFLLDCQPEECRELFNLLDDGDGEIATNEFLEGLTRMKGAAQAKDVYRLQKTVTRMVASLELSGLLPPPKAEHLEPCPTLSSL